MSLGAGKKRLLEELLGEKKLLLAYDVSLGAGKKRLLEELLGGKKLLLEGRTQVVQVAGKKHLLGCSLLIRAARGGGVPGSCAGRTLLGRGVEVWNSCRVYLDFSN